jgi:hypothetical protein
VSVPTRVTTCPDPARWIAQLDRHSAPDGDCIVWTGHRNDCGYGRTEFRHDGTRIRTGAHRAAWLARVGDIPAGLEVDHLCKNRLCLRIDHLELVSHPENIRRSGPPSTWDRCKAGHPFDEANTARREGGKRRCRICQAKWEARSRERRRARAARSRLAVPPQA